MNRSWLLFLVIALLVADSMAGPMRGKDKSSRGHSGERRHRGKGLKMGHEKSEDSEETNLDEASNVAAEAVGTAVDHEVEAEALQTALEQSGSEESEEEKQEVEPVFDGPPPMTLEIKFEDVPPPAPETEEKEEEEPLIDEFLLAANSGSGSGSGGSGADEAEAEPLALGAPIDQAPEESQPEVAEEQAEATGEDEEDEEESEESEEEGESSEDEEDDEDVEEELANFHFLVDPGHVEAAANNVVEEAQQISQHIINDESAETEQVANLALNDVVEHVNDVNDATPQISDVFSTDDDESDEEAEQAESDFLQTASVKTEDNGFDNEMHHFMSQIESKPAHAAEPAQEAEPAEPVQSQAATNQVPVNVVNDAIDELNKVSDDVKKVVSDLNGAIEKAAAEETTDEVAQPTHAKIKRDTAYTSRLL